MTPPRADASPRQNSEAGLDPRRWRAAVVYFSTAALLFALYLNWLFTRNYDLHEFGYAPFAVDAMPWSAMRGFTWEQFWSHISRAILLGPALVLASIGCMRTVPAKPASLAHDSRFTWVGIGVSCLAVTLAVFFIFRGRAIIDDELVYHLQAEVLSHGRLTAPNIGYTPPEFFDIATLHGYTGSYLPGEPLVQIPGLWLGYPALAHILLTALTLIAFHRGVLETAGSRVAAFATIALGISPAFVFTSATGLSHSPALTGVAMCGLGAIWCTRGRERSGAALLSIGLALCFAVRPQVAFPAGLVFGPWAALGLFRARSFSSFAILALGFGIPMLAIGAYNHALSGSYFQLPWFLKCDPMHFGFGRVWLNDTYEHTPLRALENLLVVMVRFNVWWLGLPLGLLLIVAWLALGRPGKGLKPWLWLGAAIIMFEAGFYIPGVSDTGPVYHLELLFPCSFMAGAVLDAALARWGKRALVICWLHLVFGTMLFFAEQGSRLYRLVHAIHDEADTALAQVKLPALVLHEQWESERRIIGWIGDSFPRRYRALDDPIVTLPRPSPTRLVRVRAVYPGRNCYYYHRLNATGKAELLPCEEATAYLSRPTLETEFRRMPWIVPSAYRNTNWDPLSANHKRHFYTADGKPRRMCCHPLGEIDDEMRAELAKPCVNLTR
jgi:hypothetical protein